jgi:hypothetical protein
LALNYSLLFVFHFLKAAKGFYDWLELFQLLNSQSLKEREIEGFEFIEFKSGEGFAEKVMRFRTAETQGQGP